MKNSIVIALVLLFATRVNAQSLETRAQEAYDYAKANKMNTSKCILIDMSIHSGKSRLFVWDFNKQQVIAKGICSHGSCDNFKAGDYKQPVFTNTSGSHCSSLGKYRIGARAYSNWGINVHYKLHGLEATNSNAYKRIIVLHSFGLVPNKEVYPTYAPTSWGCPMVSDEMMTYLDGVLKKEKNVMNNPGAEPRGIWC